MKKKLVILLGVSVCLLFSACGSNSTPKNDAAKDAKTSQVQEDEASDAEDAVEQGEEPEEKEPEETAFQIGDNSQLKDWAISVTDVKTVDSIKADYGSFSPEEGNKYLHLFVTVTNNGKTADTFMPTMGFGDDVRAKVLYGDGYEFSASNLLGYSNEIHDSTVNPLSTKTGELAFAVPASVADGTEELLVEFSSGNDTVVFKIR